MAEQIQEPATTETQAQTAVQYLTMQGARELFSSMAKGFAENFERKHNFAKPQTQAETTPLGDVATATRLADVEKKLQAAEDARRTAVMERDLRSQMADAGIDSKRMSLALAVFRDQHSKVIEWEGEAAYVRKSKDEVVPLQDFVRSFASSPELDIFRAPRTTTGSVKTSTGGASMASNTITHSEFSIMAKSGTSPDTMKKVASGEIKVVE